MKPITLKEFADLAKNDEALKEKIVKTATRGGNEPDEMIALAAELGYELELEEKNAELEAVSDDALEEVAGGFFFFGMDFCIFMVELFGHDETYCNK